VEVIDALVLWWGLLFGSMFGGVFAVYGIFLMWHG